MSYAYRILFIYNAKEICLKNIFNSSSPSTFPLLHIPGKKKHKNKQGVKQKNNNKNKIKTEKKQLVLNSKLIGEFPSAG